MNHDKSAIAEGRQVQAKSGWDHIWDAKVSVSHGAYNLTSKIILLNYTCLTTTKHNFTKTTFLWETQLQHHFGEQIHFNHTALCSLTTVTSKSWSDHKLS